jgi:hypothetical protein
METTEAELAAVIEGVLAARAVPLLVAVDGPFGLLGGDWDRIYRRLGERYGVPVAEDALVDVLYDPALKSDTIHPNAAGYRRLADELAERIEPWVAARRAMGIEPAPAGAASAPGRAAAAGGGG